MASSSRRFTRLWSHAFGYFIFHTPNQKPTHRVPRVPLESSNHKSSLLHNTLRFVTKSFQGGPHVFNRRRKYSLGIWGFGLGYYLFYTPYSGLTKGLSNGLFPAMHAVDGTVLLPVSVMATVAGMLGFITLMRWWKFAGHREFFGISIPFPRALTFLSGICMATIIGTTTLAFTFGGISILLVLVLLRGGVLIIAPVVDAIRRRRVRWFSWVAMWISLMAVLVILKDAGHYKLTLVAIIDVAAYLTAYFLKFQFMTALAKSEDRTATLRYFVEEQMIASPLLLLALGAMAAIGAGNTMMGFRLGFTLFLGSKEAGLALLIGLFYAALCICTTFIFLDRRENTFCVPVHCGSSILSGLTATYVLSFFFNQSPPSGSQLASAGLIFIALGFLSPLHHFRLYFGKLKLALTNAYRLRLKAIPDIKKPSPASLITLPTTLEESVREYNEEATSQTGFDNLSRVFLFVCSGNTCRSPLAA
ncbi:MAG TPA: hypothetical protein VIF64_04015, partial [Pyrinomonadaceae bacterium]